MQLSKSTVEINDCIARWINPWSIFSSGEKAFIHKDLNEQKEPQWTLVTTDLVYFGHVIYELQGFSPLGYKVLLIHTVPCPAL